ncbi:polyketide synthase [Longispora fulva]|uniref:Acyl transferase domain-containing protein n=1 Tax=Longispora fulva TaxID=619741 RepID=A0A8J7GSR2_9ACTN|nr:beta-ketoacyl synthase N-terminal-like domain-containing protein [Longispora fulva]MBG6136381.1 acyl transferase domain-containing protein [Longispora fulva]GIG63446.1 polyketide synthase [Longispora fulva]
MLTAAPVAVVGMACLFPGAGDLDAYWRNLTTGVDSVTDIHPDYDLPAEQFPGGRGGFVGALATVDAIGMGVMPAALPGTEPDQLIALHVATAALADAGGRIGDPERVAVILGRGGYVTAGIARIDVRTRVAHQLVVSLGELLPDLAPEALDRVRAAFLAELGPESRGSEIGVVPNLAASRIAHRLGLGGPAYTIDAACASSLLAVDHAVTELTTGRCDLVLAGGVHHGHDATLWSVFSRLGALSATGRIRPLHRDADGLLIGEGTGVVVLKRLTDARRDGDRVYAVIRGTGVASDAGAAGLMQPATSGQVLAVRRAWQAAGLDPTAPDAIGLLEAHGTATPAGDAAELATLRAVFGPGDPAVIGSVKSMIGHTMPAAGIAGLIKAALAVHHGVLPPTLHCDDPHPDLAGTRFHPIDAARPWQAAGPRRAAVNAFGFGGISAHVILEQHGTGPARVREHIHVLRLVADSPHRLAELLKAGVETTGSGPGCRLAIVEPTEDKKTTALRVLAAGRPWRGRHDIWFSPRPLLAGSGQLAFVYPGLESDLTARVDDVADRLGLPAPRLSTDNLALHGTSVVAVSRLLDTALRAQGIHPDALAGHSIGEWTAMVTAGMYSDTELDDVLGTLDPDTFEVPDVVFATIGRAAEQIAPRLTSGDVVMSHDNSPNQCVVCGPADQVRALLAELLDEGVFGQVLPFRSGFHTPYLRPYLDRIRRDGDRMTLRAPGTPIWSATTAAPYPADLDEVRALFSRHLVQTVRFRPLIESMYAAGIRAFVQVGPGQLSTLVEDVLRGRDHLAIAASSTRRTGLGQLARVAAALWAEGRHITGDLLTPRDTPGTRRMARLDLGGKVVSLGPHAPRLIEPTQPRTAGQPPGPATTARPASLATADESPGPATAAWSSAGRVAEPGVRADLRALLADTERAALDVLAAAHPSRPTDTVREMSLQTMPYLRDHAFFGVPDDWPDPYDGFPVVPATELVRQMMAAAEHTAPGQVAVAVHDARFDRWLAVEPPVDVTFQVRAEGASRLRVTVVGYAQAIVELADRYPHDPPAPSAPPPEAERTPRLTGRQMYDLRWMFHGPGYQGVSQIHAIGDRHIRGVLTTPDAPGGLLDSAGHLISYWTLESFERDSRLFPVGFGAITLHSAPPTPGEQVTCLARITDVTGAEVIGAAHLVRADGTVWARVDGWRMHRFASDDRIRAVERSAGTALLADRHDAGWYAVRESWPDLASRELMARSYLTRAEWADYERQPPRTKRNWLLGRLALKDAVRAHLLAAGHDTVFPAELETTEHAGQLTVTGRHGLALPELDVSAAHSPGLGVALVRPAAGGTGIAVTAVGSADLDPADRALLDGHDDPGWPARLDAARHAVARAEGCPADWCRVTSVRAEHADVRTPERVWSVGLTAQPAHIVAWTRTWAPTGKDAQ